MSIPVHMPLSTNEMEHARISVAKKEVYDAGGSSAEEPRVRVMSEDEARDYQGVTIEEHKDGSGQRVEDAQNRYGSADGLHGSGIRIHTFGTASSMNWLTKAALVVGGAAVVAFLVFVALPVLLAAAGIGVAAWLLLRFFRG